MSTATFNLEQQQPERRPPPPLVHTPHDPDPTWSDGWLSGLRSPRLWYALAFLLVGGALWAQFNPEFGNPRHAPNGVDSVYAHEHFLDEAGAFDLHWGEHQRWIGYVFLLALLLLVPVLMRRGRRRGIMGLVAIVFSLLAMATSTLGLYTAALWLGAALVVGSLWNRRVDRSSLGTTACWAGIALLGVAFFLPYAPPAETTAFTLRGGTPYDANGLRWATALGEAFSNGFDAQTWQVVADHLPQVCGALILLFGLLHVCGLSGRGLTDAAVFFLAVGVIGHLALRATGSAPDSAALDSVQSILRGLTGGVPHDMAIYALPLAAAVGEATAHPHA